MKIEVRLSPDEFRKLREPWSPEDRETIEPRLEHDYRVEELRTFTPAQAQTLGALLRRLIPEDEGVDLVGFVDRYADNQLGRGDRPPGGPPPVELYRRGLDAMAAEAGGDFAALSGEQQDEVIRRVKANEVSGPHWGDLSSGTFLDRIYRKALHGYLSHPRVWMRIGFYGASYPEGYAWLSEDEVKKRRQRAPGWERM